jgi:vancomycin resistance protein YoaR
MPKTKLKPKSLNHIKPLNNTILFFFLCLFFIPFIITLLTNLYFIDRTYPNISIANNNIGGLNKSEISKLLESKITTPQAININIKEKTLTLSLKEFNFSYDFNKTIEESDLPPGKTRLVLYLTKIPTKLLVPVNYSLKYNLDQGKLDEFINILANEYSTLSSTYSIELKNNSIIIDKGVNGETLDKDKLKSDILYALSQNDFPQLNTRFTKNTDVLNDSETAELQTRARNLIGKKIVLTQGYDSFTIVDGDLVKFLAANNKFNLDRISDYVIKKIAPIVERPPQNASFIINENKVEEFLPAIDGIIINKEEIIKSITDKIASLESSKTESGNIDIPVLTKKPDVSLADVNNLGIKELIGRGSSIYKGSISSRIFNIGHAAAKFKSILVPPNEIFSFDQILGDVSALTGYKQAYIIQDGRTVLGDGGGVCQVSTTLFRAVLNAGLPVIERRAHSYRVGYYEQGSPPGIDATVFYPTTDFKFKNDTPGYLLIQSVYEPKNYSLVFEIYGTPDGRISTLTKPVVSNVTSPPDDLYVDDPTLPMGQIKQIDHKAWGAKVTFNYKVERNGEILIDKNFVSNYQPWQSVFLRGTGAVN